MPTINNNENNNNNKQSNELNVNRTIEERLMKLESKFNILIDTSEIKKEALQKPSYAAIDINKTRDSHIELEVAKNETEKIETKRKSRNIIIHGVEEFMDTDPKELENEGHKYVENVIMKPMELIFRLIGVFTHEKGTKRKMSTLDSLP